MIVPLEDFELPGYYEDIAIVLDIGCRWRFTESRYA
jgi:hypothetical protein